MLLGQIQHERPLPRNEEPMDPHKVVKDPPRGRVLHWCALLLRKGSPLVFERCANAVLQRRSCTCNVRINPSGSPVDRHSGETAPISKPSCPHGGPLHGGDPLESDRANTRRLLRSLPPYQLLTTVSHSHTCGLRPWRYTGQQHLA